MESTFRSIRRGDANVYIEEAAHIRREFTNRVIVDVAFYNGSHDLWNHLTAYSMSRRNYGGASAYVTRLLGKLSIVRLLRLTRWPPGLSKVLKTALGDVVTKLIVWDAMEKDPNKRLNTIYILDFAQPMTVDEVKSAIGYGLTHLLSHVPLTQSAHDYLSALGVSPLCAATALPQVLDRRDVDGIIESADDLPALEQQLIDGGNSMYLRYAKTRYLLSGRLTNAELLEQSDEIDWDGGLYSMCKAIARLDINTCEKLREKHPDLTRKFLPEWAPFEWWSKQQYRGWLNIRQKLHAGLSWSDIFSFYNVRKTNEYIGEYDRYYDLLIRHAVKDIARTLYYRIGEPGGFDYHQGMMSSPR